MVLIRSRILTQEMCTVDCRNKLGGKKSLDKGKYTNKLTRMEICSVSLLGIYSKQWSSVETVQRWKQTGWVTSAENDSVSWGIHISDLLLGVLHSVKSLLSFLSRSLAPFPYLCALSSASPIPCAHNCFPTASFSSTRQPDRKIFLSFS